MRNRADFRAAAAVPELVIDRSNPPPDVVQAARDRGARWTKHKTEAQKRAHLPAVTLDGERWALIFPPVLYQFVTTYLTIPANVP